MNAIKKMLFKRAIRKNAKNFGRAFKDVSKDVSKRIALIRIPARIRLFRS
jgi:hypothetical protein